MSRALWILLACLGVLLAVAGGAFAYDSSTSRTIAPGVSVAGVQVGGMNTEEATKVLTAKLGAENQAPVVVVAGNRRFRLTAQQARVKVNVSAAVNKALDRSRSGWIGERVWRNISGAKVSAAINPHVKLSLLEVNRFVDSVAKQTDREPVEAHLLYTSTSLGTADGSNGIAVSRKPLANKIVASLGHSGHSAVVIKAPTTSIAPKTTRAGLAESYPTVITVSRSGFKLYLWKGLKLDRTYPIAVGMAGLETPTGLYSIQDKQENPSWHVPNSAWAGALAGKVIPPGPDNPIRARWMGVAAGAGIHGTSAEGSLGSAASHGCIRMAVSDVIDLYDRVSVGDPVYIN